MKDFDTWVFEQNKLGNVYHACSTGAVTLSTVSATCTGLALSNPDGSGRWIVPVQFRFAPSTAPAGAAVVGLAISPAASPTAVTHTAAMVVHKGITLGSNVGIDAVGKVDSSATLPAAPVWFKPIASVVAGSSITPTEYVEEPKGTIILPPGTNISLSYLTNAAVGIASVTWVEIPAA